MSAALLAAAAYLTKSLIHKDVRVDKLDELVKQAHVYSGLDKDNFYGFLTNFNLFKEWIHDVDIGSTFLYKALEHLENIGLMTEFQDDISELAHIVGYYAEKELMNSAINRNVAFHPKYLNSRL
jgi:hypothetical protein